MWQMYNSVLRSTNGFNTQDWMQTFACLTLLSFVVLLAFGSKSTS